MNQSVALTILQTANTQRYTGDFMTQPLTSLSSLSIACSSSSAEERQIAGREMQPMVPRVQGLSDRSCHDRGLCTAHQRSIARFPSSALLSPFLREGSPTKIDYRKKIGYPYSGLLKRYILPI